MRALNGPFNALNLDYICANTNDHKLSSRATLTLRPCRHPAANGRVDPFPFPIRAHPRIAARRRFCYTLAA